MEMICTFVLKIKRSMPGKKYYVVWKGLKTGVFDTWKECEAQVRGVDGAAYKSFTGREEALKAFQGRKEDYIKKRVSNPGVKNAVLRSGGPVMESISVDAACSGNPGVMEYRGVDTKTGNPIFHKGPFPLGTNNIGEFLAIVHALALLKKTENTMMIYSDSRTAIKWVKDKAIKTKLPRNDKTEALFDLLDRAVYWLQNNDYANPVMKWETEKWGEIPADFGRKG
jgi:ribonuclease HI